ncbi:MAG TPA: hypothetical protein VKG86_10910 [Terracidiphilus sp.]|nr:hypothetical protein [Terracidiphilus sp.]
MRNQAGIAFLNFIALSSLISDIAGQTNLSSLALSLQSVVGQFKFNSQSERQLAALQ